MQLIVLVLLTVPPLHSHPAHAYCTLFQPSIVSNPPAPPTEHTHAPSFLFFFNDTANTEIYTLSLHDALPIWLLRRLFVSSHLSEVIYVWCYCWRYCFCSCWWRHV